MENKEIREKRLQGYDLCYPLFLKIKEKFDKVKIANKFNQEGKEDIFKEFLPLSSFEYVMKKEDSDLEKYYIREILDWAKMNEIKLIINALKNKKSSNGPDIFFSGDFIKENYSPYLKDAESVGFSRDMGVSSELSFEEIGTKDIDNDEPANCRSTYLVLKIKIN